jgi:hypothetical protein
MVRALKAVDGLRDSAEPVVAAPDGAEVVS